MDVNLTLARLRDSVRAAQSEQSGSDEPFTLRQARNVLRNLAREFSALDESLSAGGDLPQAWDQDPAWRDAYHIAWVGACNPNGVQLTYVKHVERLGSDHPAVRAIRDHLGYLNGESLGPSFEDLEIVTENAKRLGLMPA